MKRLSVALLAGLILAASCSAYAQAPAAAPAPAAASPAALTAAKEMVTAMNMRQVMGAAMKQMAASMPQIMSQTAAAAINASAKLNDAQKKQALAEAQQKIPEMSASMQSFFDDPKMIDEMVEEIAPIYARNFTVDEIHQITAFYQTATGAKMLRIMPQLMGESMQVSQKVIMPRISKMMEKIVPPAQK